MYMASIVRQFLNGTLVLIPSQLSLSDSATRLSYVKRDYFLGRVQRRRNPLSPERSGAPAFEGRI